MDLSSHAYSGSSAEEFPNSRCRAVQIPAIVNFAYCMSDAPSVCPHSLYFGKMYLCRHLSCQTIVKQTGDQSI